MTPKDWTDKELADEGESGCFSWDVYVVGGDADDDKAQWTAEYAVSFTRFSGHPSAWSESRSVMKEERYATEVSAAVSAGVSA